MEQPVLSYESLVAGTPADKKVLRQLFESQGWAFLQMPAEWSNIYVGPAVTQLEAFFQEQVAKKQRFSRRTLGRKRVSREVGAIGFRNIPYSHKASLTCATGTELEGSIQIGLADDKEGGEELLSNNAAVRDSTRALAAQLDSALLELVKATSQDFFGLTPHELGDKFQLPLLLRDEDHTSTTSDADILDLDGHAKLQSVASFALFDAAYYKNVATLTVNNKINQLEQQQKKKEKKVNQRGESKGKTGQGYNCAEHYDPGLYSLWVGETEPGLKLKDAEESWVSPPRPPDVMVLWVGKVAQDANSKFTPAWHRVDAPPRVQDTDKRPAPRLSVWSELCTANQVLIGQGGGFKFASVDVIEVANATRNGNTPMRIKVEGGDLEKAMRTVESIARMPMSKMMMEPIFNDDGFVVGTE